MHKRIILTTIIILSLGLMTGCSGIGEFFTGGEKLTMTDVPKNPTETETESQTDVSAEVPGTQVVIKPSEQPSEKPSETPKPSVKPEPSTEEPEPPEEPEKPVNKTGDLSFEYFVYKGSTSSGLPELSVISTESQISSLKTKLSGYSEGEKGITWDSVDKSVFIVIAKSNVSKDWSYSVEKVVNEDKLSSSVLCDKTNEGTEKCNAVIIVAINKADVPNTPSSKDILLKELSYKTISK